MSPDHSQLDLVLDAVREVRDAVAAVDNRLSTELAEIRKAQQDTATRLAAQEAVSTEMAKAQLTFLTHDQARADYVRRVDVTDQRRFTLPLVVALIAAAASTLAPLLVH